MYIHAHAKYAHYTCACGICIISICTECAHMWHIVHMNAHACAHKMAVCARIYTHIHAYDTYAPTYTCIYAHYAHMYTRKNTHIRTYAAYAPYSGTPRDTNLPQRDSQGPRKTMEFIFGLKVTPEKSKQVKVAKPRGVSAREITSRTPTTVAQTFGDLELGRAKMDYPTVIPYYPTDGPTPPTDTLSISGLPAPSTGRSSYTAPP